MKKAETFGIIKNGKVHYIRVKDFLNIVYQTFNEGDRFKITFEKLYKQRSNNQNRFYWGVVLPILLTEIREQGNDFDTDTLHNELKNRFGFKKEIHNKDAEVIEIIRSTSDFWSCDIPDPNEQTEVKFN